MRVWPEKKQRHARIEIIPMIDVMMFLLVFFVLISINVLPALGLRIKPPTSAKPDQVAERQRIMIGIDRDGKTFVDGTPVEIAGIADKINALNDPSKKLVVVIAGDEAVQLQVIVSVLDALKIANVGTAQIVTKAK
jgi:biopolymer transport protein ExbD